MLSVMYKITGFLLIIILGYILKIKGLTKKEDSVVMGNIVLNVTLPCALLTTISDINVNLGELSIILLGILANLICLFVAKNLNRQHDSKTIAISMLNASGYNIGAFLLPFVQYFYNSAAIIYVVLFDIGNAIMVFSVNNAIASTIKNKKMEPLFKSILSKCLHSVPFMTYMFILILSFLHLSIPNSINELIIIPAKANVFLSMLMIGTMLDFDIDTIQKKVVRNILLTKYLTAFILIVIIWLLPINVTIKIMLSLALCAPSSIASAIFSNKIDGESPLTGIANTTSALISIILIISIILVTS
jgi:hypothetical protein